MLTKEEKAKLEEIKSLFDQLDSLYQDFNPTTQDFIREYHNEEGSLPHCLRWGLQATEELLEVETVLEVGTMFSVKEDFHFETGFVPQGANAKLVEVHQDELLDEEGTPFQMDFDAFVAYNQEDDADGYCEDISAESVKEYLEQKLK